MSEGKTHYDYFVIGGGSGGVRSARIAAGYGAKVGLAEKSHLGGTCVNLGCVPKKLMIYGSDHSTLIEDAPGFGWNVESAGFDWATLTRNVNNETQRLSGLTKNMVEKAGVQLNRDHARFIDANTLDINGTQVTADQILIATGGRPKKPDIRGAEHMVTSDDVYFLPKQPDHIIIIGGGYVAVEFARVFAGLGSKVTLFYYKPLFLRSFDKDLALHLAEEMEKQGINLCFDCDARKVKKQDGGFLVETTDGKSHKCDLVMAATGRSPNTETLDLDKAGVETDNKGFIKLFQDNQTSIPHIHAVGDVTPTYHLAPVAIAEGHALADRLFGQKPDHRVNYENIATVVFSNPPIGTIGYSEELARKNGYDIDVYTSNFRPMRHSLPNRDQRTLMKLIVDKKTDRVLGCHMIGLDAPEIMQGFSVAMNMGATKADFDRTMAIHPTSAEEFVLLKESNKR